MQIAGDTILITGGGSGIGRGLAEAFHAKGAKVIVAGRRQSALDEVTKANRGVESMILDVEDAAAIQAFAVAIAQRFPALNVLINNAGIMKAEDLKAQPFDLAVAEATIATNILGPIRLTQALLPHLRKQAEATVMNVTSGLAFVPLAFTPTYNATKAAMHSYSQSLRLQLADTPVEVIELIPPGVQTDLMPGHAVDPNSMTLEDYITEVMGLLAAHPAGPEIQVERVKFLSEAERRGDYAKVLAILNPK